MEVRNVLGEAGQRSNNRSVIVGFLVASGTDETHGTGRRRRLMEAARVDADEERADTRLRRLFPCPSSQVFPVGENLRRASHRASVDQAGEPVRQQNVAPHDEHRIWAEAAEIGHQGEAPTVQSKHQVNPERIGEAFELPRMQDIA